MTRVSDERLAVMLAHEENGNHYCLECANSKEWIVVVVELQQSRLALEAAEKALVSLTITHTSCCRTNLLGNVWCDCGVDDGCAALDQIRALREG